METEKVDCLEIPKIIKRFIVAFTETAGVAPNALYLGRLTKRHLAFALAHDLNKITMREDRDYYLGLPIYTVDCENYISVS